MYNKLSVRIKNWKVKRNIERLSYLLETMGSLETFVEFTVLRDDLMREVLINEPA